MVINVQIPVADVVTTLSTEEDYDWVFAKDKEDDDKSGDDASVTWPKWLINNKENESDLKAANAHEIDITHHDRHFEFEILLDHQYPFSPP